MRLGVCYPRLPAPAGFLPHAGVRVFGSRAKAEFPEIAESGSLRYAPRCLDGQNGLCHNGCKSGNEHKTPNGFSGAKILPRIVD